MESVRASGWRPAGASWGSLMCSSAACLSCCECPKGCFGAAVIAAGGREGLLVIDGDPPTVSWRLV